MVASCLILNSFSTTGFDLVGLQPPGRMTIDLVVELLDFTCLKVTGSPKKNVATKITSEDSGEIEVAKKTAEKAIDVGDARKRSECRSNAALVLSKVLQSVVARTSCSNRSSGIGEAITLMKFP